MRGATSSTSPSGITPVEPRTTGVGRDREARRHRQLEHRGHLCEVGALAAEEVLQVHRRAAVGVVEVEDVPHGAPWWTTLRCYGASPAAPDRSRRRGVAVRRRRDRHRYGRRDARRPRRRCRTTLVKVFPKGNVLALDGVSLQVPSGRVLRAARAERRGQDDPRPDPVHDPHARQGQREDLRPRRDASRASRCAGTSASPASTRRSTRTSPARRTSG